MSNKNKKGTDIPKKPAADAPEIKNKEQKSAEEKKTTKVEVIDMTRAMNEIQKTAGKPYQGLDPNHQVELARLNAMYFKEDQNAEEKYGKDLVEKMNRLNVALIVTNTVQEAMLGNSPFALTVKRSYIPLITEVAKDMNIVLDVKMLPPAKTEESKENEEVQIPAEAFKPSTEIKKAIKEEATATKNAILDLDPTKIENDEQLSATLLSILKEGSRIFDNFIKATNFYQAVMKVRASKASNSEEELAKINAMPKHELFETIAKLIGKTPFILSGLAKQLSVWTGATGNPISSFLVLRQASKNRKTNVYAVDDETIANMTKTLINWNCSTAIAECKKNIEALSGDKEKNSTAIEQQNTNIAYFEKIMNSTNSPSFEGVSKLNDYYGYTDKNSNEYKYAHRLYENIINNYYPEVNVKEVDVLILKNNVEQMAGIILNYFCDPLTPNLNYSAANLKDFNAVEEKKEEESKK